ncbi:MAG: thiol:disulfide interchange protein DsbC [Burkholderiaceae bacterium]
MDFRWVAAFAAAMSFGALAQVAPAAKGEARTEAARVDEAALRGRVEARMGAKPDSVTRMPFGLYEVVIGTEIFYVDAAVNYVIAGRVFDARTREDLTSTKRDELLKVDVKSLPLENAVKIVRGDGSRTLVTFEDPNCPYCKKLFKDLDGLKNVTIYTFLYPILSQDSFEKSRAIWCAKDRATAWADLMGKGQAPAAAPADCKHPLQQVLALGRKLDISGTPTLIFPSGKRAPGAVPLERIEQMLAEPAAK